MKISQIKNHIANGGKFFVKDNGIIREVRFKSIVMRPHYNCSVCSWSIEGVYEVATEHAIEKRHILPWHHNDVQFYSNIASCAEGTPNPNRLYMTKGDGSLVDDSKALDILRSHGVEVASGYYTYWPYGYVWDGTKVVGVHPIGLSVDVLNETIEFPSDCYKTAKECKDDNGIKVVMFAD